MNLFKICKNYLGLLFNDLYTIDTYLPLLLIILLIRFKYLCSCVMDKIIIIYKNTKLVIYVNKL